MSYRRDIVAAVVVCCLALGVFACGPAVPHGTSLGVLDPDPDRGELLYRFAVASDGHYGQTDFEIDTRLQFRQLVAALKTEKQQERLDKVFLCGDIIHDDHLPYAQSYSEVQVLLNQIGVPYYAVKGNHDYLDPNPASAYHTWRQIWGYPSNHRIVDGRFAFVLCDTSEAHNSGAYLAANIDWLQEQLDQLVTVPFVFVFMHIAQRDETAGEPVWPGSGVGTRSGEFDADLAAQGQEVMDLIATYDNVKAVFHGHNHNQNKGLLWQNKPYLFAGRFGSESHIAPGYRLVEVYRNGRWFSHYREIPR